MHPPLDDRFPQSPNRRALFDEIAARILDVCRPVRIVIFGSFARSTEGPNSDVDVLVVDEEPMPRRARSIQIRHALRGLGLPVDVIVTTPDDIERYGESIGLIYGPAMQEGLVIYEQPAA